VSTTSAAGDRYPVHLDAETLRLTQREIAVITLVAQGYLDKQVARALGIQITTVRSYIERIGRKTGRTRRAELTAMAYELDLLG
jgi:DNA-binding NarL/FixJ family response regulator